MHFKKYFSVFLPKDKPKEHIVHHKRKIGVFWSRLIRIITIKFVVFLTLILFFLFFGVAYAQAPMKALVAQLTKPKPITQSATILSANVQSAIQNLASQEIKQQQANANVAVNTLNSNATQTSQGGAVQSLVTAVQVVLTTNPIDKAKLRLLNIDRQIIELQNLLEKDKSDRAVERAINLIRTIGQETGQVVADPKAQSDREVLTTLIQQYNRIQLVIQKVEDQLPIASYLKIEDAREIYLEKGAQDSLNSAPNLEVVNNIGIKEVAKIVGNDFAELKAIEILSDLESGLKPETKQKLGSLEKELATQFEKRMLKLPRDVRERKLQNYMQYSYGNPLRQAESFERIKQFLSDREMILAVDSLKELSLHKLEDRVFEIKDQDTLNQFLDTNFQTASDLKVLVQLKLDVLTGKDESRKARIAQLEQNSKDKVIEKFGKVENMTAFLSQNASASADLLDVVAITQLSTSLNSPQVGADVKNAIKTIKQNILQNLVGSIVKKGFTTQAKTSYNPVSKDADVRLLLVDPQAITLLEQMKTELPAKDQDKIAIAQKAAIGLLTDHVLLHINDPAVFKEHEQLITGNPQVGQLIQQYVGQSFFASLSKKKKLMDKQAQVDQQALFEKMQQIVQQIFIAPDGKLSDAEKELPTEVQTEINKLRQKLADRNVPKLTTPEGVTLPQVAKLPDDVQQAIVAAAKQEIKDKAESKLAKLDLTVQAKDLGVSEPTILPGNLLYPVIEVVREIPVLLTRDPIDKAEKQLVIDNQRTLEAAKLLEGSQSQETVNLALAVLDKINQDFDLLKTHVNDLKKENPAKVDKLVDQIIENGLARQTVLSSIEDKVYGDDYVKVEVDRQAVLKNGIAVLLDLTDQNAKKLTDKLEAAVAKSQGSDLKDIKAVELLTEIERTQPELVQQVLNKAEANLAQDLETKLLAMPKEQRTQEVLSYAENAPGNPIRQFEAYDTLKKDFKNPETIALAEGLKDKAVENLTQKVSEITDANSRAKFVDAVIGDKPQDLKIAIEIEQRVAPPTNTLVKETLPIVEKVQDIKANIEQNIIDTYKDKPAELAKTDFYQSATSTTTVDITDVKVAADLTEVLSRTPEVNADVKAVAKQEEAKIIDALVTNISKPEFAVTTNPLAAETLNPVPETIAELVALKAEAPPAIDAKIDIAIKAEVNLIEEHLTTQVNDPATLQAYVAQIQENPVVAQTVTQVGGAQFSQAVETKVQAIEVVATQQQTQLQTTVTKVQQEIFSAPVNNPSTVEQTLPQPVQEQIQQIKQEIPTQQIPQVTVATTVSVTTPQATQPVTAQPTAAPATTAPQSAPEPAAPAPPAAAPPPAAPEVKPPEQPAAAPQNPPAVPGL